MCQLSHNFKRQKHTACIEKQLLYIQNLLSYFKLTSII